MTSTDKKTYAELRDVSFPTRRNEAERLIKEAKLKKLEVPSSLEDELRAAESQCRNALNGRTVEEAREEVLKAIDRVDQVYADVLRIFLAKPYQEVRKVRKSFKGDEDLAAQHIPNYNMHTENFLRIEEILDNWASRGKELDRGKVDFLRKQLREFLKDFKTGEKALSVAIKKAEKAKWMSRIIIAVGVATLIATIILGIAGIIIGLKGCSDSSQETAQPEATASAAEP